MGSLSIVYKGGNGMKAFMIALAMLFIAIPAQAAVIGPGGGLGYTCTDNPGEKKTCTCTGSVDCWWMGRSGVCGKDVVLTCSNSSCTCEWVKGPNTGGRSIFDKDGNFHIIEMN